MTLQTWWLYVCAVFLICGTPGPNMLHILTRSVHHGLRRSTASMAGCMSANILACVASATGLSAVLTSAPLLFDVIKYAGVGYLVYLGLKSWRDDTPILADATAGASHAVPAFRLFRDGFWVAISNPKLLLFAAALFPQFINKAAPQGPQFAILVATFAVIELFWFSVYAIGGRRLARVLTRASAQKAFNRFTGALFVGFGAALLGYRI